MSYFTVIASLASTELIISKLLGEGSINEHWKNYFYREKARINCLQKDLEKFLLVQQFLLSFHSKMKNPSFARLIR